MDWVSTPDFGQIAAAISRVVQCPELTLHLLQPADFGHLQNLGRDGYEGRAVRV